MNKLLLCLCGLAICVTEGCSSDSKEDEKVEKKLMISADKPSIIANGKDKVTFTVKDGNGTVITNQCAIFSEDKELSAYTFATDKPGKYEFTAKDKEGNVSEKCYVVAVMENAKLVIHADKTSLLADGGDLVNLTLTDEFDRDITDGAEFFDNGTKIEGRVFKTATVGMHTITARWNNKEGEDALVVAAVATTSYTGRMLAEFSTATNCKFCAATIKVLDVHKTEPRLVLVSVHRASSYIYTGKYGEESKKMVNDFVKHYSTYVPGFGEPVVFLNREPRKVDVAAMGKISLTASIPVHSEVGISIRSVYDEANSTIKITACANSKKSFKGKIGAILVENGIMADQINMGEIEMVQVMRNYAPSFLGAPVDITAKQLLTKEFSFIKGKVEDIKKTKVIVYVTNAEGKVENVQQVGVGESIGY